MQFNAVRTREKQSLILTPTKSYIFSNITNPTLKVKFKVRFTLEIKISEEQSQPRCYLQGLTPWIYDDFSQIIDTVGNDILNDIVIF